MPFTVWVELALGSRLSQKKSSYVCMLFTANLSAVKPRLGLSNFRIVKNVYVLVFVYSFEINM